MSKPIVYIASPYTIGDEALNVRAQMEIWDRMVTDGKVLPFAPLLSHFQHLAFPRPYQDWIDYDLDLIKACVFNACLRINAVEPTTGYFQSRSVGADGEEALFAELNLPIFYGLDELYQWVEKEWRQ
jgi:hypothetical protein